MKVFEHQKNHSGTTAITLFGEILIDRITKADTETVSAVFGGSPANIARNITQMGVQDVRFFGAIGTDDYGAFLLQEMDRLNISSKYLAMVQHKTSVVDINQTDKSPEPTFFREADYQIPYTDKLENSIQRSEVFHFTYWPLSKNPAKTTLLKAIQYAKQHGVLVGFDPNYHADLVEEDSIKVDELIHIIRHVDIIKPSLDDAKRIFGDGYTHEEYLGKFRDLGVQLVVMTLGKDGLIACYKGDTCILPSKATEVIDATGAGDAFTSGLYAGLMHHEDIKTILEVGLACSAYNLRHVGGECELPSYHALKREFNIGE